MTPKHSCHPYSVLLQVGFAWPTPVTRGAVRSYRTFSPLPRKPRRFVSVALSLGLPPPDVIRHFDSVEPGLSSPSGLSALEESGHPANWRNAGLGAGGPAVNRLLNCQIYATIYRNL